MTDRIKRLKCYICYQPIGNNHYRAVEVLGATVVNHLFCLNQSINNLILGGSRYGIDEETIQQIDGLVEGEPMMADDVLDIRKELKSGPRILLENERR